MDEKQHQTKLINPKLILFPITFQGHVTPMLHLANLLHSKSFSITIIQSRSYNPIDPTHFPLFDFHFLEDNDPVINFVPTSLAEIQEAYKEPFRVCLGRVLLDLDSVCCLISDALWFFASEIAESLKLRNIVLWTGSISSFVVDDQLPSLRDKGFFLQGTKLEEALHEIHPLKMKDIPSEHHHETLGVIVNNIKTSNGIIFNSFDELETSPVTKARQILSIPVFPIGPLHKYSPHSTSSVWTQDRSPIPWLDQQPPNSVLYVSFGTMASINPTEFLEIAWGLANSKQPFLWVVRPGQALSQDGSGPGSGSGWPEGFLEMVKDRGHIVEWAPQVEILAHRAVGGFWTHCGWNSTIESISEGVPMLCLPFVDDQAMNARYISEYWKVGLVVEDGIRRDEIETGIRKLMVGEEGEGMRSKATSLKECAMLCLVEGGSSSTSLEDLTSYLLGC